MAAAAVEGAREWETLKYDSFFIPNTILKDTDRAVPRDALSSCSESGLTAFAQLAALRLDSSRALISLFDRHYQYVIAESTRSMPLRANSRVNVNEDLWLCGTAVPRSYGICEQSLVDPLPCPLDEDAPKPYGKHSRSPGVRVSVVPDLTQDERFHSRPYVQAAPHHRFYAGVPIRSAKGFNIGVLCVFDDKPRESLSVQDQDFMIDLSHTVMDYLDARRVNDSYIRSEKMVLGLGNFLQGRDEPSNWWPEPKPHANRKPQTPPSPSVTPCGSSGSDSGIEVRDELDAEEAVRPNINPTAADAGDAPAKTDSCRSVETTSTSNSGTSASSGATPVDPHQAEVDKIFNKAANIIRESLSVDGALFLDASVGSFGGLVVPSHRTMSRNVDDSTSSSEDSSAGLSTQRDDERPCKIFAASTTADPLTNDENTRDQHVLTEKFMKKLLRRYPNGKVFSFDESGGWYSGESSGEDDADSPSTEGELEDTKTARVGSRPPSVKSAKSATRSPYSRRNEAKGIGQLFPEARSIAMVPLWDPYRNRWYAGGFVWSRTASRILTTDADLPYLRAFGMVAMAEITRLDVMIADKAKTDILGSLSHELRSPLHGVVAAAELLHDTALDAFQVDVVHTIEISGKTLLDTIDHLLAYSKINTFLRASRSQRKNSTRTHRGLSQDQGHPNIESGMMTLVSDISLDVLAEEVVESVFIGHSFQHMVASQLSRHGARGNMTPAQERLDTIYSADLSNSRGAPEALPTNIGDVQVIIDIDPHRMWDFHTQPGAIRRIIMNLFGNALKYTSRGHVKVSLQQESTTLKSPRSKSSQVVLTVEDTGKGISDEFLRNKLFTPFSQEDHLAPGTGLGLSLVRQIVASLSGSISVKSLEGEGTTVIVTIPLSHAQKPQSLQERDNHRLSFDVDMLNAIKASAIGFSDDKIETMAKNRASSSPTLPIESLPLKWYNMTLCDPHGSDAISPDADLAIYSEASFCRFDSEAVKAHTVPSVVVCHNAANAIRMDAFVREVAPHAVFEFIHQPNTPRKFGKTVACALTRHKELKELGPIGATRPAGSGTTGVNIATPSTRAAVHFAPDPSTRRSPSSSGLGHSRKMSDVTCRMWNLDIDPEFQLKLPHRRGSRSSPGEGNGAKDVGFDVNEKNIKGERVQPTESSDMVSSPTTMETPASAAVNGAHKADEATMPAAPERATSRSDFLVVDDNVINLKILCTFMKRLEREYCTSMDGRAALDTFTQNPGRFCCILMDINMPVMDGLESSRRIRHFERKHSLEPVTIIAITGLGSITAREEAYASGVDLFLTRPVRMKELLSILQERGLGEPDKGNEADGEGEHKQTGSSKSHTAASVPIHAVAKAKRTVEGPSTPITTTGTDAATNEPVVSTTRGDISAGGATS